MKLSYQSRGTITWTKLRNSEEVLNRFISVKWVTSYWGWCAAAWKENFLRVQCRSLLVARLIANKCYVDTFYFLSFLLMALRLPSLHTCLPIYWHQIICGIIWLAWSYLELPISTKSFVTLWARPEVRM